MPKHLSKIQERGYESKSIQEGEEEEGNGESGYREGEGANVNGAGCLPPAACPPVGWPAQAPFLAVHCDTKLVVPQ